MKSELKQELENSNNIKSSLDKISTVKNFAGQAEDSLKKFKSGNYKAEDILVARNNLKNIIDSNLFDKNFIDAFDEAVKVSQRILDRELKNEQALLGEPV